MNSVTLASGFLQVVSPATLDEIEKRQAEMRAILSAPIDPAVNVGLAGHIRSQFEQFRTHRDSQNGWNDRLLNALRVFNGEYDPAKLYEIRKFGGSEVYARLVAMKCRGATSLLRDIYLSPDRPWGIEPPADPDVPEDIIENIRQLVTVEATSIQSMGQPIDPSAIRDRTMQLMEAAREAAKKEAKKRAKLAEDRIQEILDNGGFYKALAEFLVDLPMFPFACIKGPVVRVVPSVSWKTGKPEVTQEPRMFWERVSPFDIWWTPGVSDIESADVIERTRITRADLNDLLDLPGYDHDAIRKVLDEYGRGGLMDTWDSTDSERAQHESRENPVLNQSGLITCYEYHGNVQGRMLREYGFGKDEVPDDLRDYAVQAWMIGNYLIKVQLSPNPRKRHPYYITSFEKMPGTPVGNGLPDIIGDLQEVANAMLRTLVNNMSIASGPQVVINDDRLAPGEDGEELYPWKRWHITSDPMGNNTQVPISFFQPNSNAQELLTCYERLLQMADELSAIPKHLSGQGTGSGPGRTAAGLAMLMGNANKILQTVAANIDRDVIQQALHGLYDMVMLTDETGMLRGDEQIRVMGVNVAVQRETQRSRQLEFLQITANPMDAQIMGAKGRAAVLRAVSQTIGLDGLEIVPDPEDAEKQQQEMMQQQQMAQMGAAAAGGQQGPASTQDMGPRVRVGGGVG